MRGLARAAVIGGGVIGAGWAARLIHNGVSVSIFDTDRNARQHFDTVMANADLAMESLAPGLKAPRGTVKYTKTLEGAVENAELVIESVPERVELKRSVHARIDGATPEDALITSSTSGILPSVIQEGIPGAHRILVAHPFNPVYLLPLVELCAGKETSPESVTRASALFSAIGMHPLVVRKEIDGFIADRLMEALWREALWLVNDGIATTEEVDDAVRYAAGLRWAMMGTFQTFWLAGGEGGMRAMLAQFGPCLKWPWTHLMDVPELTDELIETVSSQCDQQAQGQTVRQIERVRDQGLVRILRSLEEMKWGAGQTLAAYRRTLETPTRAG